MNQDFKQSIWKEFPTKCQSKEGNKSQKKGGIKSNFSTRWQNNNNNLDPVQTVLYLKENLNIVAKEGQYMTKPISSTFSLIDLCIFIQDTPKKSYNEHKKAHIHTYEATQGLRHRSIVKRIFLAFRIKPIYLSDTVWTGMCKQSKQ